MNASDYIVGNVNLDDLEYSNDFTFDGEFGDINPENSKCNFFAY